MENSYSVEAEFQRGWKQLTEALKADKVFASE